VAQSIAVTLYHEPPFVCESDLIWPLGRHGRKLKDFIPMIHFLTVLRTKCFTALKEKRF